MGRLVYSSRLCHMGLHNLRLNHLCMLARRNMLRLCSLWLYNMLLSGEVLLLG